MKLFLVITVLTLNPGPLDPVTMHEHILFRGTEAQCNRTAATYPHDPRTGLGGKRYFDMSAICDYEPFTANYIDSK